MAKSLFCFIGKEQVDVQDDRAIAKLCPEHDTEENRKLMLETPIRQLLAIQDEGLRLLVEDNKDTTAIDINSINKKLEDIKAQIEALPTEVLAPQESAPTIATGGQVNEWGEII